MNQEVQTNAGSQSMPQKEIKDGVYVLRGVKSGDGFNGPKNCGMRFFDPGSVKDFGKVYKGKLAKEQPAFRPGFLLIALIRSGDAVTAVEVTCPHHYDRYYRQSGQYVKRGYQKRGMRLFWVLAEDLRKFKPYRGTQYRPISRIQPITGPPIEAMNKGNPF